MPYLGNQPDSNFTTTTVDTFNGDNSTVAFTLSRSAQTNDLEVFVENVQQQPTTAYSVAGTTITFTSAPPTGTGNIYVIHRGAAITSPTLNADSITTAMLQDGVITQAKIASGAVSSTAVSGSANTATDFFALPKGTTAQRPGSPDNGYIRYNTTEGYIEEYRGGSWRILSNIFVASGGTETTYTSGGIDYKVHTFTSSGTFEVISGSATIEYIVVAGGGGGARYGAGGAGGVLTGSFSGTVNTYSITVGAGGNTGAFNGSTSGTKGSDSSISGVSITALGGGAAKYHGSQGGSATKQSFQDGGSGSGGDSNPADGNNNLPGLGTSGQGYDGSAGNNNGSVYCGGGGGGAGAAGSAPVLGTNAGNGGIGLQNSLQTGSNQYYAGGGGGANWSTGTGGTGGSGGGGNGATDLSTGSDAGSSAGTANTGGGGGGGGLGNGGSGIVIIRYAV